MSKLYYIRSLNIRKMHFWDASCCCIGIICLHTPTKSSFVVILRGHPSFYDHWFTIYGFCNFFAPFGLFPGYWPKIRHLFFLTLLGSYTEFLKKKWMYMEVHTGGNSAPAVTRIIYFFLLAIECDKIVQ